jgi:diacylglycerol kinase (ATP)
MINLRHLYGAFLYSLAGLKRGWQEQAFRHEALVLLVMPLMLWLIRPGLIWSVALLAAWLLVMALELLNSAIEETLDLITKESNIHVKHGKDLASAAVFLAVCANGLLWACMLWGRLYP